MEALIRCGRAPAIGHAEDHQRASHGDHHGQGEDGEPDMMGGNQQCADDEETHNGAHHVHQAVVAGGLAALVLRHLVGQHALVGALGGVRRDLEEDVGEEQSPERGDKRDQREEDDVADDTDRDERATAPEREPAVVADRPDRRLPDDGEGCADRIQRSDVGVDVGRDGERSEVDRHRVGEAVDQQRDDGAAQRLHHVGNREPEGAEHEHAGPGQMRAHRGLVQRPEKPPLARLKHARHPDGV